MDTNHHARGMSDMPTRLSTLWIVIMFNMVFADILSFMYPGFLSEVMEGRAGGVVITPGFLLLAAVLAEVPIAMIVLSRVLPQRVNRWANIVAAVITIAYVAGGSSTYPHGIFFTTVQVVCALVIIGSAWKWRSTENAQAPVAVVAGTS
jgi:hypothetical protein